MSINNCNLSGNITNDPEVRTTASGNTVLSFSIAVNDRVKNGDGWTDYANFFNVAMFGNRAAALSKILVKGMKVAIAGKLRWSQYETKDGQKRNKVEIIADDVELMNGHVKDTGAADSTAARGSVPMASIYDEDVPF